MKSVSTTPFSINDILTKSNSSLRRKSMESSADEIEFRLTKSSTKHNYESLRRSSDSSPIDTESDPGERGVDRYYSTTKINIRDSNSPVMYYTNHNNNNSLTISNCNSNGMVNCGGGSMVATAGARRGSLDCFLVENDHHPSQRLLKFNDGKGIKNYLEQNKIIGRNGGDIKMNDYYHHHHHHHGYSETPLDMRRCASNDSGNCYDIRTASLIASHCPYYLV